MFDNNGDSGPPCGVPLSVSITTPFTITPALRYSFTSLNTRLSAIFAFIRAISLSPGTVATEMQREIKASGINPVSQLDWDDHIPPEWVAKTLLWMCGAEADAWLGAEVSLRDEEIRQKVGLI